MEQALLRPSEVARIIALGRSKTYELIQHGEIASVRIGRSVRVPTGALQRWIADREAEAESWAADGS